MNRLLALISCLVLLNWTYFLYRILKTLRRFPPPRRLKPEFQNNLPFVSILVPARNEARNIERCIRSLLALDYPRYEIVAVDDRSTDETLAILRRLETETSCLNVLSIEECREGWSGKNHALHAGVQQARGAWFLFTDADTVHEPQSLRLGIQEAREHNVGFVSFYSRLVCRGFWEGVIQPTAGALVTLWYPIEKVNRSASDVCFANGQYLLIDRGTYARIGGHQGVRTCLLEDVALCRAAVRHGVRVRLAVGTFVFRSRMYHGFRESRQGWTRNFMLLSRRKSFLLLRHALGLALVGTMPAFALLGAVLCEADPGLRVLAAGSFCLSVAVRWWFGVLSLQPRWPALWIPVSALVTAAILLQAAWHVLAGKTIEWRGIGYPPPRMD